MSTGTAPIPAPEGQPLSQVARVVNTFVAPSKTFADIRRSASWWLPWLLVAIAAVAFSYTVDRKIGYDRVVENTMRLAPKQAAQLEQLPPEQRARALQMQVTIRRVLSYGAPVSALIWGVIIAAVMLATFNFGAGAEMKFGSALAVVFYSSLPAILKDLLAMLSISLPSFNAEGFILQNPAATNVGYFLDPSKSIVLYSLGSALDVFTIWTLVLSAIGFAIVGKVKKGTSYAIVFGWFVVMLLIGVGLAMAFA